MQNDQNNATYARTPSKMNWCGYDSMLHAKICSTNTFISNPVLAAHTSKLLHNINSTPNSEIPATNGANNRSSRLRHRHHNEFTVTASPQVQGYSKLLSNHNNGKLNTALLNQLNPQLTQEQKLTRTMNHVEKWLNEDQTNATTLTASAASSIVATPNILSNSTALDTKNVNCKETNLCKDDANYLNNVNSASVIDKLKENDKSTKKAFNKEILLTRKTQKPSYLSSPQRDSSNSDSHSKTAAHNEDTTRESKESIMEYASIPIIVDPSQSECENLLRASSDESSSQIGLTDNASSTTVHRYVHIHHHYYHH